MNSPRVLELREYEGASYDKGELREEEAAYLYREFGDKVSIEPPSFKTGHQWNLKSEGWVGFIPVDQHLGLSLQPKVELGNLFRMLEYAYNLKIDFLEGVTQSKSLEEFYARLANVLAKRVLDRSRRGFYRTYLHDRDRLPYLRGSLEIARLLRRPWDVRLACEFEEHTADVEENQLLSWTLRKVVRSGACTQRVLPTVRRAYRAVSAFTTPKPFSPEACLKRLYNRLNDDYQPMHALCRFFLENTGPTHHLGDREMLPFLVDMALLFERFVARWLETHAPADWLVRPQENLRISVTHGLDFRIDLVISDKTSGAPLAVVDTKYKKTDKPDPRDVHQIVTYALAVGCRDGFLVYPEPLPLRFDEYVGPARSVRVRSAAFGLGGELEANGSLFLSRLAEDLESGSGEATH